MTTGVLELFPDRSKASSPGSVTRAGVAATPPLGVLVLLRDVRDTSQPLVARRAWLDRAHDLARQVGVHEWFDIFLALVRHDVLLGDVARARREAERLRDVMLAKPPPEITSQSSRLRDALHRSVRALRLPILGRSIGLPLDELVPAIVAAARSDTTTDDVSRLDLIGFVAMGLIVAGADAAPAIELLENAARGTELAASPYRRVLYGPLYWTLAVLARQDAAAERIAAACVVSVKRPRGKPSKRTAAMMREALRQLCGPFVHELSPSYLADAVWRWGQAPVSAVPWEDEDDPRIVAMLDQHIERNWFP